MTNLKMSIAVAALGLQFVAPAHAVVLNMGDSAKIDFTPTTATAPFDFVVFNLMFSEANPFGPNEALSFSTTDGNGTTLVSPTSFPSGDSVYTSGLFGQLTQNAIQPFSLATALTTLSFSLVVTATSGSFDLIGATADFQHVLTSGTNQFGVVGTFAAVPEPSTWAMMALGFASLGFAGLSRSRKRVEVAA